MLYFFICFASYNQSATFQISPRFNSYFIEMSEPYLYNIFLWGWILFYNVSISYEYFL